MRRLIWSLLLVLGAAPAVALCTGESLRDTLSAADRAALAEAVAATPHPEGLVWTATRGDRHVTLVGTMHIPDPRLDAVFDRIAPALADADRVLLEMTPTEEAEAQAAFAEDPSRLFLTEGPTLPELLDERTWQRLTEAVQARQVPAFMAAKFRPWYLSMTLSMPPCAMADLQSGKRGLDFMIMDAAEAGDIPMQALEPWDTLFLLFEGSSMEEQLDMLRVAIQPEEVVTGAYVAMLEGYFDEDIAEIWELSRVAARSVPGLGDEEAEAMFAETEETLLHARNRRWLPVIEEAEGERLLVAVGAAHLPGEEGLLRLLEGAGWTVARAE